MQNKLVAFLFPYIEGIIFIIFSLTMRGLSSDQSVICTNNQTFQMLVAETSNNLLLLPDCKLPEEIDDNIERAVVPVKVCYFHKTFLCCIHQILFFKTNIIIFNTLRTHTPTHTHIYVCL